MKLAAIILAIWCAAVVGVAHHGWQHAVDALKGAPVVTYGGSR